MGMTKGERAELLSLVKKRERVMKAAAAERSAALLAEFDAQSAKIYHFDDDAIWSELFEQAKLAVADAQAKVAKRAKAMGIPNEFAPGLSLGWHGRGHNAVAERRAELRRAAKSKIESLEKEACTNIEKLGLQAQTEIVSSGLESQAAIAFLQQMPRLEVLMPPVPVAEMQALIETRKQQQRLGYGDYDYN